MFEKDFEFWFTHLWRNYSHDEIASFGIDPKEREKILGDYEFILERIERTLGRDRLLQLQGEYSAMAEKYGLDKDNSHYIEDPEVVFKKILEELQKESARLDDARKKVFVSELGALFAKYEIAGVSAMRYDERREAIEVLFENNGRKLINVACDNEWAMIIDIGKQLEKNEYIVTKDLDNFAADKEEEADEIELA